MTKEELNGFAGVVRTIVREELEPINKRLDVMDKRVGLLWTAVSNLEGYFIRSEERVLDRHPD